VRNAKLLLERSDVEPTPKEMGVFCRKYSSDQWEILCLHKDFIKAVSEDLQRAKEMAERILK